MTRRAPPCPLQMKKKRREWDTAPDFMKCTLVSASGAESATGRQTTSGQTNRPSVARRASAPDERRASPPTALRAPAGIRARRGDESRAAAPAGGAPGQGGGPQGESPYAAPARSIAMRSFLFTLSHPFLPYAVHAAEVGGG